MTARLDGGALLAHVTPEGDCLVWAAAKTRRADGSVSYGRLRRNGRSVAIHRLAYEIAIGPIPPGMEVRHTCDNPPCIRPDHLLVGTHADNMADKVARRRSSRGRAVLGARDVLAIRAVYRDGETPTPSDLAAIYGVTAHAILEVITGKSWGAWPGVVQVKGRRRRLKAEAADSRKRATA